MLYNVKTLTLKIGDTEMDYVSFGRGGKPLVLLPGLSLRRVKGAGASLAYMYRIFAEEYKVYLFDRKEVLPDGYTVRDMARDTACAMQMLGLSNADVFGISQGGMIAQYLAIDHPQLVHKLVLGVTLSRENETARAAVERWIALAERGDYRALVLDLPEKMYSEAYRRKYQWLFPVLSKAGPPKGFSFGRFVTLARACLTCNTYDKLEQIKCPVLVLGGGQDKVVTGKASVEIAEKLGCALYMYDELGHAAYEEAKDFNKRILAFLNQ